MNPIRILLAACLGCGTVVGLALVPAARGERPVVSVVQPVVRETSDYDFPAVLELAAAIEVRAGVDGVIERLSVCVGDAVAAGDSLAAISSPELNARLDDARAAVARFQAAVADAERRRDEARRGGGTRAPAQQARLDAEWELAQAEWLGARAELERYRQDVARLVVRAPVEGVVASIAAPAGTIVVSSARASTLVCRIVPRDEFYATFEVDEPTLLRLRKLAAEADSAAAAGTRHEVLVRLPGSESFTERGTVDCTLGEFHAGTQRTRFRAVVALRAEQPGPAAMFFAKGAVPAARAGAVRLTIGRPRPTCFVPPGSVGQDSDGQSFVFVVDKGNVVRQRRVVLGALLDGLQGVDEGLSGDDRVAVRTPREPRSTDDDTLVPGDFVADLRLPRVVVGAVVEPVLVRLGASGTDPVRKPANP